MKTNTDYNNNKYYRKNKFTLEESLNTKFSGRQLATYYHMYAVLIKTPTIRCLAANRDNSVHGIYDFIIINLI